MRMLWPVLLLAAVGCGGKGAPPSVQPTPQQVSAATPAWYTNPPSDPYALFAAASADARELQAAVNEAALDGREALTRQLDARFADLRARLQDEAKATPVQAERLAQATQGATAEAVGGARVTKQEVVPIGTSARAFVLLELPTGAADRAFVARVRADEALVARYRGSRTWREVEAAAARYEEAQRAAP